MKTCISVTEASVMFNTTTSAVGKDELLGRR